jgi:hypothetical protein
MPNVATIAPQHRSIEVPDELQALPGWLVWRYEQHPGEPKPRKVPYYVDGGRRYGVQGSPQDRGKLTTFAMARDEAMKRGFDGIGLALMPDWGVTALDFDKCVGPNGVMPHEIVEIIGDTYSEYSPSGEGVRAFVRGDLGNHKSHAEGDRYGFETFNTNGFVTITGRHTPYCEIMGLENTIAPASDHVIELAGRRFVRSSSVSADDPADFMIGHEPKLGLTVDRMQELLGALDADMGREDWIKVGMALHHECEGDDTGFELWDEWSTEGSTYPGTEGLRGQWESFDRRAGNGHRQVTMETVLKMVKQAGGSTTVNPSKATTADDLRRVVAKSADIYPVSTTGGTPPEYTGKFPMYHAAEVAARPPGKWWIKGLIPEAKIGAIFGASGSGKSFCVIDLMAHLSLGWDWRGMKGRKGNVLYVAAEGGTGIGKRIKAWCQHHNVPETALDITILLVAPNIMLRDDIEELVVAIKAAGGFAHIVLDTYAQVTPGANENTAEDMGLALSHCAAIGDATDAQMHLVHHAGKDASKGARGWSGINAALDYSIEVTRDPDTNYREMRVSKMKDGEDGMRYAFKLDVMVVGMDDDGDEITSCVAVEADLAKGGAEDLPRKGVKKLGRVATHILETIETQIDPFVADMAINDFIQLCADGMPAPEIGKRDIRRQDVQRSIKSLTTGADAPILIEHGRIIFMTG